MRYTQVLRLLAPAPVPALNPVTLREVLGSRPDPMCLAALEAEVRHTITQYRVEVATGVLGRGVLTVRGRALSRLPRPRHRRPTPQRTAEPMRSSGSTGRGAEHRYASET